MIVVNGPYRCPVCSNRAVNYDSNEDGEPNVFSIKCVRCPWAFDIPVHELRERCRDNESWITAAIRLSTERMAAYCVPQINIKSPAKCQHNWETCVINGNRERAAKCTKCGFMCFVSKEVAELSVEMLAKVLERLSTCSRYDPETCEGPLVNCSNTAVCTSGYPALTSEPPKQETWHDRPSLL